ncbi:single-stranded-DNA-specific exonuclease RecJ [Lachnospiraceae bacterium 29-84]
MEKWVVSAKRADFKQIARRFGIDQVTARIIRNRDIIGEDAIEEYLHATLEQFHSPWKMKDMETGVSILQRKLKERKHIRVIGDYDIDGVFSVYILYSALRRCGGKVDYAIPHRIIDGYGLNARLVRQAREDGVDTILTCDNGIAAAEEIALAKDLGIDVVITDHHEVPYQEAADGTRQYQIPLADAVINPKQPDCTYPFSSLCGAAVAFKLVQALYEAMGIPEEAFSFLEYAAFATIGDVMDLVGENRTLVKEGLKALNHTKNYGLRALAARNQIPMGTIKPYHVGFVLGPCINACGRLDTAERALRLLLAEDEYAAAVCAGELYDLNLSRKEMTEQGTQEAIALVEGSSLKQDKVLVVFLPDCHESLAGIIAGRIREQYNRPAFLLTKSADGVKGSGRSIEAYSMFEEMSKCKELFTKYGGHPMAAGLSLPEENVDVFRRRLNEYTSLTEDDLRGKIVIDVPMPLDYISKPLIEEFQLLEPFGKSNEKPVFADRNIRIMSLGVFGQKRNVCRMHIRSQGGTELEAVYFGQIDGFLSFLEEKYGTYALRQAMQGQEGDLYVSFLYYPEINVYNGRESLQVIVKNYC